MKLFKDKNPTESTPVKEVVVEVIYTLKVVFYNHNIVPIELTRTNSTFEDAFDEFIKFMNDYEGNPRELYTFSDGIGWSISFRREDVSIYEIKKKEVEKWK